jgi:hypothetical protein
MATLASALDTPFTPAAGDFIVQATGGTAILERRNTSGAAWAGVGEIVGAQIISNPVAGAQYQFRAGAGLGTPTVQADQ